MLNNTKVSEIMTHYVTTVTPNTLLGRVNEVFSKNDFHHLPVVEGETLVGIITRQDVDRMLRCVDLFRTEENRLHNDKLFNSILAEEVMTSNPIIVAPNDTIGHAAVLFSENKFHALPVVKDNKLMGMLTTFDLIDFAYNAQLKPVPVLEQKHNSH